MVSGTHLLLPEVASPYVLVRIEPSGLVGIGMSPTGVKCRPERARLGILSAHSGIHGLQCAPLRVIRVIRIIRIAAKYVAENAFAGALHRALTSSLHKTSDGTPVRTLSGCAAFHKTANCLPGVVAVCDGVGSFSTQVFASFIRDKMCDARDRTPESTISARCLNSIKIRAFASCPSCPSRPSRRRRGC